MIYRSKCVFSLSPYMDTSVVKTNTDLCTSAVWTNPFPSLTTGDQCNLFLCQDSIPESVNFGMWTKRTMHVLSLEQVIYCFTAHMKPRSTFPTSTSFPCFLLRKFNTCHFYFWVLLVSFLLKRTVIVSSITTFLPHFQTTFPLLFRLPAHLSPAPFILFWEYS